MLIHVLFAALSFQSDVKRIPTMTRLTEAHLAQVRSDVAAWNAKYKPVPRKDGLIDLRCILHAHSYLSHDSRGTIKEIAEAAKFGKIDAVLLTNHPKKDEDVVSVGQKGSVEGVLFVSGAETNGFLAYPGDGRLPDLNVNEQKFVDSLRQSKGMVFVAHPEEHTDWSLKNLTGMEIYNTHADVKDETEMMAALQPKNAAGFPKLLALLNLMSKYPQEAFAALWDYPAFNLAKYDQIANEKPLAAVAGNDSHQNTGFVVSGLEGGKFLISSPIGEKYAEVDTAKTPAAKFLFGEPVSGKEAKRWIIDPYPVSMHHVSTHVLANEKSEAGIRQALAAGRSYVAFDWMGDSSGFSFSIGTSKTRNPIGETIKFEPSLVAEVRLPLPASIVLIRNGKTVARSEGHELSAPITEPGLYRVEVSVIIDGETRGWIYTGGIRVKPDSRSNFVK